MYTIFDAAAQGDLAEVERLLEDEPKYLNRLGQGGWTALFWAAAGGHAHVVQFLLSKGADAHIFDDRGHRALYWAAQYDDNSKATRLLVAEEARRLKETPTVAEYAAERETLVLAVHGAVYNSDYVALAVFFQSNPDLVNCKDEHGTTPLSIAGSERNPPMVDYLLSKGADPFVRTDAEQAEWEATLAEDRKHVAEFIRTSK